MNCPECQGAVKTVDSRERFYGVYRRRVCRKCAHRFSTIETLEGVLPEVHSALQRARAAIDEVMAIAVIEPSRRGNRRPRT